MWFLFSLLTALLWGAADLFYKKAADPADRYSHLKTTAAVGLVMGAHAIVLLVVGSEFSIGDLVRYLPVSALYISSMALGYFGLRFIQLSISSPVQNASGALTAILLFVFFTHKADPLEIAGIVLITVGVVAIAAIENSLDHRLTKKDGSKGVLALTFPLLYCLLDALGTFADGVYLDELQLISEDAALVSYELTFLAVALVIIFWLYVVKKQHGFLLKGKSKYAAAALETAGQYFYVFAMSDEAILAAPLVASYSIFSAIFAAVFLKERLDKKRYISVAAVLLGIAVMGLAESL